MSAPPTIHAAAPLLVISTSRILDGLACDMASVATKSVPDRQRADAPTIQSQAGVGVVVPTAFSVPTCAPLGKCLTPYPRTSAKPSPKTKSIPYATARQRRVAVRSLATSLPTLLQEVPHTGPATRHSRQVMNADPQPDAFRQFGAVRYGYIGGMWKRMRSALRWLGSGAVETVPRWWLRCPICDRELVGPWNAGVRASSPPKFPAASPTRDELIAKCPVHGHAPYNDATKKPSVRRIADESQPSTGPASSQLTDQPHELLYEKPTKPHRLPEYLQFRALTPGGSSSITFVRRVVGRRWSIRHGPAVGGGDHP